MGSARDSSGASAPDVHSRAPAVRIVPRSEDNVTDVSSPTSAGVPSEAGAARTLPPAAGQQDELRTPHRESTSRWMIDCAEGILIERYGWSPDEAFAELVRGSQASKITVRDVAALLIDAQRETRPASAAAANVGKVRTLPSNGADRSTEDESPPAAAGATPDVADLAEEAQASDEESRAYCGPAHGRCWPVPDPGVPVDEVELCSDRLWHRYRLVRDPRTRHPARDQRGGYVYVPSDSVAAPPFRTRRVGAPPNVGR